MFPRRQSGEGAARPAAAWLAVMGRGAGVGRPAAAGEDTALRPDDALGRRLPFDGQTGGCVADTSLRRKSLRAGDEPGKARSSLRHGFWADAIRAGARITSDQCAMVDVGWKGR